MAKSVEMTVNLMHWPEVKNMLEASVSLVNAYHAAGRADCDQEIEHLSHALREFGLGGLIKR